MFPSTFPEVQRYPELKRVLKDYIDMQFSDLRTLLKLPRKWADLDAGQNFATSAVLLNVVSGASVCFYNANISNLTTHGDRATRFTGILRGFYPWGGDVRPTPQCISLLWEEARNPLAHSFGLTTPTTPDLKLAKSHLPHRRIMELEDSITRPSWCEPTIFTTSLGKTGLSVPTLYWGVHRMLHKLFRDSAQVANAETFCTSIT